MSHLSALGVLDWEQDLVDMARDFLAGDRMSEGAVVPRHGALSRIIRVIPVYLQNSPALSSYNTPVITDGFNILINRSALSVTDEPADLDDVDLANLTDLILQGAEAVHSDLMGATTQNTNVSFVGRDELAKKLSAAGLDDVNGELRFYDEATGLHLSAIIPMVEAETKSESKIFKASM